MGAGPPTHTVCRSLHQERPKQVRSQTMTPWIPWKGLPGPEAGEALGRDSQWARVVGIMTVRTRAGHRSVGHMGSLLSDSHVLRNDKHDFLT